MGGTLSPSMVTIRDYLSSIYHMGDSCESFHLRDTSLKLSALVCVGGHLVKTIPPETFTVM